ncbi:MAG: hypothetical protein KGR18_02165 [Acidobacteria bacterium]|nr:hypothetical protein [Acidobacteriota bacterium]
MSAARRPSMAWLGGATLAVLRHPSLWGTALRQIGRLAPVGWWRRAPFLPLPDPDYLRFRLITAYGGEGSDPQPSDLLTYLHWCRAWPEVTSGS